MLGRSAICLDGNQRWVEIDGEREAAALMAAIPAASIGEIARQRLGDCVVGAGGMPTPSLATRERVDALVDHGVVPVSLACHVTLHDVLLRSAGDLPVGGRHR